ncbi:hypothetical protein [Gilliamella sp. wkB112]|uniref:hypothetical protein n=1 Tax=Gilliamella sp. wkB112 TaxID=3120257 RepID=UPI00080E8BD9|nr:hypothetical protein [Gilliamella apicola]OCG00814.1 hypothetical protein A9G12_03350 [Gilliamella apicola]
MRKIWYLVLLSTSFFATATDCELLNQQATENSVMISPLETYQLKNNNGEKDYLYSAPNEACRTDTLLRSDEISTLIVYSDYGNFYYAIYFLKDHPEDISGWVKKDSIQSAGYRLSPQ